MAQGLSVYEGNAYPRMHDRVLPHQDRSIVDMQKNPHNTLPNTAIRIFIAWDARDMVPKPGTVAGTSIAIYMHDC